MNLPSTHDEAWRYTNLAPIAQLKFVDEQGPALSSLPVDLQNDSQLVFVNGHFNAALSTANFADAVTMQPLAQLPARSDVFSSAPGVHLHVHGKAQFRVLHITDARAGVTLNQPRVAISVDQQATIVERFATLGNHACFTNAQTEITLKDGAQVLFHKWQDESAEAFHIAHVHVTQGKESRFEGVVLAFGGKLARTSVACELAEATHTDVRGLLLAGQGQTQDVVTTMHHGKPYAHSNQVFKCVVAADGRTTFDGRITVAKDAQKTDARQKNQNLLLSKEATANSKPHLEIYADDVKCAHGSTSGQLSDEAMFYLRSRGIPALEAKALLTMGFAGEVLAHAPLLESAARERVSAWLR